MNFVTYSGTVKKCMEYEAVGSRSRGKPKRTWIEVVQRDCQVRGLSKNDAMVRGRWRKLIRMVMGGRYRAVGETQYRFELRLEIIRVQ